MFLTRSAKRSGTCRLLATPKKNFAPGMATDWTPDEFERHGQEVLALLRDYFAGIEQRPVLATTPAEELLALLDRPLPQEPESFERILADTREQIIPNLTHW